MRVLHMVLHNMLYNSDSSNNYEYTYVSSNYYLVYMISSSKLTIINNMIYCLLRMLLHYCIF